MYFDSHCHPQFPQYDQDRKEMIKRALEKGVKMICVGTDFDMSVKAVELARNHEDIWASVGLHPNDNLHENLEVGKYSELLKDPKVIAIGEIGLDYYRTTGDELIARQKDRFIKFLELARESGKPLIIHCRDAYTDMLEMLDSAAALFGGSAVRGVIHSFTAGWPVAQKFIERGFYIGLNGIITFTDQYDETAANVSLDRLLLETDAPYLSPVPYRGKRNEPVYIEFIAKKIAQLRGEKIETIARATTENVKKLFGIS